MRDNSSHPRFTMEQSDVPESLFLKGEQTEDIPETMASFRARVKLHSMDECSEAQIDERATKRLPFMFCAGHLKEADILRHVLDAAKIIISRYGTTRSGRAHLRCSQVFGSF